MSNYSLKKVCESASEIELLRIKLFLSSVHHISNKLNDIPFMTEEFMRVLHADDIYTTNQFMAQFAEHNFQFAICSKIFYTMDIRILKVFLFKLKMMGFEIPDAPKEYILEDILLSEEESDVSEANESDEVSKVNEEDDVSKEPIVREENCPCPLNQNCSCWLKEENEDYEQIIQYYLSS